MIVEGYEMYWYLFQKTPVSADAVPETTFGMLSVKNNGRILHANQHITSLAFKFIKKYVVSTQFIQSCSNNFYFCLLKI